MWAGQLAGLAFAAVMLTVLLWAAWPTPTGPDLLPPSPPAVPVEVTP
jgi:hypothetical protein